MGTEIPTGARTETVKLKRGGVAHVRRLRRSVRNDIAGVAGLTYDIASSNRFGELACRYAVTGVEGMVDVDTGEPVEPAWEKHASLGRVLTRATFDAFAEEDVQAILRVAGATLGTPPLSEGQEGN